MTDARMATWPSGKAEACKAFTPGSNPGVASNFDNRLAKAKRTYADMAQLVEHHLAKVGVAGSNPVVRSRNSNDLVTRLGRFFISCMLPEPRLFLSKLYISAYRDEGLYNHEPKRFVHGAFGAL